jgi:hypothetical protein
MKRARFQKAHWMLSVGCWILNAPSSVFSAEPALTHLYPVAGSPGAKVEVTASGKLEPWPVQVWVDAPGILFKPDSRSGKFDVEVTAEAAPGPHLVRFFNDHGASSPRFFIVAPRPDLLDAEPNDHFASPQKIESLPVTVSGRLGKAGDVDCFAIKLRSGERLSASLEAYVLGSTFDGLLRVVDERGAVLAFNHDGRTLDPLLRWIAPRAGTCVVQVMGFVYPATASVNLTGGDGCVYRLHLTTADETAEPCNETEPNDTRDTAPSLETPGTLTGRIERHGDEDRFAFTAVKQRAYALKVTAARAGSPLDAWMRIENASGKELARNDDADGTRDPRLTWTAPEDGRFFVALGDLTHHGGPDFTYRLSIEEAQPGITAVSARHSVVVAAGKTAEANVTVTRTQGFKAPLRLVAKNLPTGVTAEEVELPAKDGEVTLKLTAATNAARAGQPFQIVLRDAATGTEQPVLHRMITTGENNGVPNGYAELVIPSTDQLWITVTPVAPSAAPPSAKSVK